MWDCNMISALPKECKEVGSYDGRGGPRGELATKEDTHVSVDVWIRKRKRKKKKEIKKTKKQKGLIKKKNRQKEKRKRGKCEEKKKRDVLLAK